MKPIRIKHLVALVVVILGAAGALWASHGDDDQLATPETRPARPERPQEPNEVVSREAGSQICLGIQPPEESDRRKGTIWGCFRRSQSGSKQLGWLGYQSKGGGTVAGLVPTGALRIEARGAGTDVARLVNTRPRSGDPSRRAFLIQLEPGNNRPRLVALGKAGQLVASATTNLVDRP